METKSDTQVKSLTWLCETTILGHFWMKNDFYEALFKSTVKRTKALNLCNPEQILPF